MVNPFHFPTISLASRSPRRAELLKQMGVPFEVILPLNPKAAEELEQVGAGENPLAYVERVAMDKAVMMQAQVAEHGTVFQRARPILCADTTVSFAGLILGKPDSKQSAQEMLSMLSGQVHQVYTAVVLVHKEAFLPKVVCSEVRFKTLSDAQIESYVNSGEPFGKAGSYAIQGYGACFVEHLSGSFSAVKGLPVFEVAELLHSINDYQSLVK
jgi:septum formation protein